MPNGGWLVNTHLVSLGEHSQRQGNDVYRYLVFIFLGENLEERALKMVASFIYELVDDYLPFNAVHEAVMNARVMEDEDVHQAGLMMTSMDLAEALLEDIG